MIKQPLKFSICIPTYNGAPWITETLNSILSQSFQNFEIVLSDDASKDKTLEVVRQIGDPRLKISRNEVNLGYGKNLQALKKLASGDVLFLMGQDDILLKDALQKTYEAFWLGENVGLVTRPYYWFDENVKKPVRAVTPYDPQRDTVLSLTDSARAVQKIFESVGQLSGLAYKREYFTTDFHEETFPAHIYPFAEVAKNHQVVFLKDYTVAVRIVSSQTRFKSSIYDLSPTASWVKMFQTVFAEEKFKNVRQVGIRQMATNFVGLIQLKNYSTFRNLLREILLLAKLWPRNLLNPAFWFYSLGTIFIPKRWLIWLVDNYKRKILSQRLKSLEVKL